MLSYQSPLIFDGHNDVLSHLLSLDNKSPSTLFTRGYDQGHLDLPRMIKGGFGGGLFVLWAPSPLHLENVDIPKDMDAEISIDEALPMVLEQLALLMRIEKESNGMLKICTTVEEIRTCFNNGVIAAVIHMEGAEAIDENLDNLEVLYRAGLRSIGPMWSRHNSFGFGVPFRCPSSPDTAPGLTDLGKEMVKTCNQKGIMVDVSHITEKGFWDIVEITDNPIVATHSNVHALSQHARNLTDNQLAAIKESGGIVGLSFVTAFLREDGVMRADTAIDSILWHLDYLVDKVGIDCIGFGSDFDGAVIPEKMKDVTGLISLRQAMSDHGYDRATILKLCHENWLSVLERTIKN